MSNQVTVEKLRAIANYDPDTGIFTRKNGAKAGTLSHHGYLRMKIDDRTYQAHRLAALIRCARSNPPPPNNNRPSAGFSLD